MRPHRRAKDAGPGVRLGVDVGTVRVGVAISDPDGILATPVTTLARDTAGEADVRELAALVAQHNAVEVVVGLPTSLSGDEGPAARAVRAYASSLAGHVGAVPVRLVDERLTTVTAERVLRTREIHRAARRAVVDQAAAVEILQSALDARRVRVPGGSL